VTSDDETTPRRAIPWKTLSRYLDGDRQRLTPGGIRYVCPQCAGKGERYVVVTGVRVPPVPCDLCHEAGLVDFDTITLYCARG
jgi:hypothetical protein